MPARARVRIGNAAYLQKQNDIYGVLLDLTRAVRNNCRRQDEGIWEFRSQRRHFTFSKVLCWVAMDQAIRVAQLLSKNDYVRLWSLVREAIRADILESGWNEETGAFTQFYGSADMDEANLLMHDYGKPTTAFRVCTFWMIKSLYLIGRRREASGMFEKVLRYANHLRLFSEGIDFQTQRLLGNFTQGYSHLALIDTAVTLSGRKVDEEGRVLGALLAGEAGGFRSGGLFSP